jgi:hypothetical protein
MVMLTAHKTIVIAIVALIVWDTFWKGLALWRAAHKDHRVWFVILIIVNTAGLLPIFYLLWFPKDYEKKR